MAENLRYSVEKESFIGLGRRYFWYIDTDWGRLEYGNCFTRAGAVRKLNRHLKRRAKIGEPLRTDNPE